MTFSDTVARQREQQEKNLKRFITYSLAGSFALHGVGLCLRVNNLWNSEQTEPDDIAIVVTEPSDEEQAAVIPEESFSQPSVEAEAAISNGALEEPNATTLVEPPPVPQASAAAPSTEEPVAEEEPEPEPPPVPLAEEVEEPAEEALAEDSLPEPENDSAEAAEPRNLGNLLEELRRAREQARPTSANNNRRNQQSEPTNRPATGGSAGDGLAEGTRDSTTAVGPIRPGSGSGVGAEGSRGAGQGTETEGTGSGENERPSQGSRSREITCQGCDFDYPESADGAEGTAQVIVETDEQGQVISVTLSGSSGNPELDRAALEQARERVRLEGARAGESYPIEIDFVQPNSAAAERAEERGNRRSITVSEPVSEPDPVASEAAESPAPQEAPAPTGEQPSEQPEQPLEPEPFGSPESTPSSPLGSEQIDNSDIPETPQPIAEPDSPLDAQPSSEATDLPTLEPELIPESPPEPIFEPEPLPEPVPEAELTPAPEPLLESAPTSEE